MRIAFLVAAALAASPSSLESLARAERDFARMSVEQGMYAAFDANFADDGIWFTPEPGRAREALAKRPRTAPTFTLDWFPTFSDVSAAGDLGYNTGPFNVTDCTAEKRLVEHGYFFTIWKRHADGVWKVALDLGIELSTQAGDEVAASWRGARGDRWVPKGEVLLEAEKESLRRREKELALAVVSRGLPAAYDEALADDFRVYREEHLPFVDRRALARRLRAEESVELSWEPAAVDVARSADLGYTWGTYARSAAGATSLIEKGYYVHVWRRNAQGNWRLAIDVTRPVAPPPGKSG